MSVSRTRSLGAEVRALLAAAAIAGAVTLIASACGSSSVTSTSPSPNKCQVALATSMTSADPGGGTGTVSVTTEPECTWEGASNVTWIVVTSPTSGQGTGELEFRVSANLDAVTRRGALTVEDQRIDIDQGAAPCRVSIATQSFRVGAEGGTDTVGVTAPGGCVWTATTGASWIRLSAITGGSGNGSLTFTVEPNAGAARSGTLGVAGVIVTIDQAQRNSTCAPVITPLAQTFGAAGGAGTVAIAAGNGCGWTATSNAAWITVRSGSSGTGNGSAGFEVGANTGAARSGTLTIAGHTFTVNQAAAGCSYAISPASTAMGAGAGTGPAVAVTATAGCAWTAASHAAWMTVTSGASGSGNGSVGFVVGANTGAARAGILTIAGQTFTVNQAAVSCSYTISPTSASMDDRAGSGPTVAVTAAAGCAWTATSTASWITITSGQSGAGNGSVTFRVTANNGRRRTGTLTIAGRAFTVTQDNDDD
jgi:hypothetical protein